MQEELKKEKKSQLCCSCKSKLKLCGLRWGEEHETLGLSRQQEVSQVLHPSVPDPTAGHLEAITGIIYNRSEVMRQKCRCRDSGGEGERERGRTEISDWPLLPCDRVSEPLRMSKPSNLISREQDFLRARRGNSLCHKSWRQTWSRSELRSSLWQGHQDAAGKWTQPFTFCSESPWEGRW